MRMVGCSIKGQCTLPKDKDVENDNENGGEQLHKALIGPGVD
jgi:hypothetical protein